jgi:PAS domain S-box-containing protein
MRAEAELRRVNSFLDTIIENIPDMVFLKDAAELRFVRLNRAGENLLGLSREEILGKNDYDFFPQAEADFFVQKDRQTLQERIVVDIPEETIQTRFQGLRLLHTKKVPIVNANGEPEYLLGISEDITEQVQAERNYRNLFNTMLEGFAAHEIICDTQGRPVNYRFLTVNPAFERATGLKAADIIGRSVLEVMPNTEPYWIETYGRVALTGEPVIFQSYSASLGKHFEVAAFRPAPNQFACVFSDITERVRAEERLQATLAELQRSNADLERFAYIASHDLQEPLRMVVSYAQLLGINYRGRLDADADEFIGYLVEGAMRMHQLLLDLLDYSSINTHSSHPQPADAALGYEMALNNLAPLVAENAAMITCDPLPTILADPAQLTEIFQILIGNAIKFHGAEPPRVHVSARQTFEVSETSKVSARIWEFAVRDNGIGIEPQYFERIFVVFQRLHTRRKYQGNGIGLAICKRIVERHGGRIWVESAPEQGSTFYFTLSATT